MQSLRALFRYSAKHARKFSNVPSLRQNASVVSAKEVAGVQWQSTSQLEVPHPDGPDKPLAPKIEQLVASITNLSLIEVSELSQALKKRLNLPDAPMFPMGALPVSAQQAATEDEEVAPKTVKTSFTVKLMKYDEKQKVALIKELKNQMEGMNLVQAKKFVESAPAVVKADVAQDEAEKLKEVLSKVGAECAIE